MAKITVNGVSYDSVDAMPPDVRRVYDDVMARFPQLGDRDGDGIPEIVEGKLGPLKVTTSVQNEIIVDGKTFESEAAMPPDVRRTFEQANRAAQTRDPIVKKQDIKMSFQISGGGLTFGKRFSAQWPAPERPPDMRLVSGTTTPTPAPIEPVSAEGRLRLLIIAVGVCLVAGLILWWLAGKH